MAAETPAATAVEREQQLVARICAGEKALFYELVAPCERSAYLTAYSILQNAADAEDVAQEAILKAFRNLTQFRGEAKFSTWLTRIVVNEARMRLRRAPMESLDAMQEEDDSAEYRPALMADWKLLPSELVERKEIRDEIEAGLKRLSPALREVLSLRDVQEKNIAETAAILGLTESVVKVRLHRARLKLRDILAPRLQRAVKGGRGGKE